jgi:hypothetical protein
MMRETVNGAMAIESQKTNVGLRKSEPGRVGPEKPGRHAPARKDTNDIAFLRPNKQRAWCSMKRWTWQAVAFLPLAVAAWGVRAPAALPGEPGQPASEKAHVQEKPHNKPAEPAVPAAPKPAGDTGPRDMLRRLGVDDSRFDLLQDGRLVHSDEVETVLRVVYRLDNILLEDIDRWANRRLDLNALAADAGHRRGEVFLLAGRVTNVEVCRPVPEVAERFEMPEYYRCEFELADAQQPAVVYTKRVPKAWQSGGKRNERAGAAAFFLKLGSDDRKRPIPVFAAQRVAWFPAGPLGDLGMDAGLLEGVKDKESILPEERETFYQLMAAVGRAKPGQLRSLADEQLRARGETSDSVVPLFKHPQENRGRLVVFEGSARRVVEIRVEDPDIRSRFGIDRYYEVSIFTGDSQGNPLVFCVPSLPDDMPVGAGPDYFETIRVAGFFLKTWAYRVPPPPDTPEAKKESTIWKKQAPLLIGGPPLWYARPKPAANTLAGAIAGGLFVVAAIGIWLAVWRYNRRDKAFRERVRGRTLAADAGLALGEIGLGTDGKPDFSAIRESAPPDRSVPPPSKDESL